MQTCKLLGHGIGSLVTHKSSPPDVLLENGALKMCNKFTGEHPCRSVVSIKLLCNFIEIAFWQGCSPVNLMYIFRAPFYKNTYGGLLLNATDSHF